MLIILVALTIFLDLFPQIQNSSLIVSASIMSAIIEIYGFAKDRTSKDEDAVDLRGSTGAIVKPNGPVQQHVGDRITQIIQLEKPPIPSQIPAPPKDFIGRKKEIDDLLAGFKSGATITGLRGMGGIGKTTFALVLADGLKAQFPDGQIFINLLGTGKNPLNFADAMAHVIAIEWSR